MLGAFQNFGKMGAVSSLRNINAKLFPTGTAGFASGLSVTEAYQKGYLFQDAGGTTAAALEQPVGLALDSSQGLVLGPERAASAGATSGLWAISAGVITRNGSSTGQVSVNLATGQITGGKTYKITFTVANFSGDSFFISCGSTSSGEISGNGDKSFCILAGSDNVSSSLIVATWIGTAGQATITNISVRELPGNHATQPTSTKRPTLSARVNLLAKTEDFSDAAWTKSNMSISAALAPDGGSGAFTLTATSAAGYALQASSGVASGASYIPSTWIKRRSGSGYVRMWNAAGVSGDVTVTSDWTRVNRQSAVSSGASYWFITLENSGDAVDVWHPDLRLADTPATLPAYQRVNTASDYDTTGFPYYLKFDGVDDYLVTPSIDMTGTDKATVFAGVRKLSDAVASQICDFGTSGASNGVLNISGPSGPGLNNYALLVKGSSYVSIIASGYAALISNVITAAQDISGAKATLRVNGIPTVSTSSQGSANMSNNVFIIGSYGASSAYFNGHMYTLPIIVGRTVEPALITSVESSINTAMGGVY